MSRKQQMSYQNRYAYRKNRGVILSSQEVCALCGNYVNKELKYPHPLSPVVDHKIPITKGGHPSALDNLQLAHNTCNNKKSDKLGEEASAYKGDVPRVVSERLLPENVELI